MSAMGIAMDNLSPSELRRLYEEEGLTDKEIADVFGGYQVQVNRLRNKYGIPTRVKSDRLNLPKELTTRQRSILIGSMLGDGGLRSTGSQTSRYVEHHSKNQREYLDWKASEWGPFVSSIIPSDKGEHAGNRLVTHGCRALFPYWQMFYPTGRGDKVFGHLEPKYVDDLALAVWFMDDGSSSGSYIRFSVGPDESNQKSQIRILRYYGLDVSPYGELGDTALHIQGRRSLERFVDLVAPYIVPSLSYKLELEFRKMGPAPRDLITIDRVAPMLDRGLSVNEVSKILNVSRNSVSRGLRRLGFAPRPVGRPKGTTEVEYSVEDADSMLTRLDPSSQNFISEAVTILKRTVFPVTTPNSEEVAHDVELLRRAPTKFDGCAFTGISPSGSELCYKNFPYRLDARYRDNPSVRMAWYDEHKIQEAVKFQIRVGDPVTVVRVFRALRVVLRAPTNFRPSLAKALVESFCPLGGLVLDPCAGYGGRAAGTLAVGRRYVGVDPHPKALDAYKGLHKDMGGDLTFLNVPYEDAVLDAVKADMVFTSPPYFSVERYSDDSTQSWVRYKTWFSWVNGFLEPLVVKSKENLVPGGVFCVNTKNIRDGRHEYPIADELQRLAKGCGFILDRTLALPIGRVGKDPKSEPIFIFRKPVSP